MKFECLDPADIPRDVWASIEALWQDARHQQDPFFAPEFARIVGRARGDVRFLLASEAGAPVAFWAIHKCGGGWARPIGGPFSDWHGPVLKPDLALTPAAFLKETGFGGMTVHGLQPLAHGPAQAGLMRAASNMSCLTQGTEAFFAEQQRKFPKHFKKMRRVNRNAKRDFSDITYTLDHDDEAAFEWLIQTKRAQYVRTGKHDVLGSNWAGRMLDGLRQTDSKTFGVMLSTLRFDGRIAAAELNIYSGAILHSWLTGFDTELAYYSPGYMLQHGVLERMHERGFDMYDTGTELDYYKKFYTNLVLPMDRGIILSGQSTLRPARLMGAGWRAAEQAASGRAAVLMGKVRRRSDQILMAETSLSGRVSGVKQALKKRAE